MESLTVAKLLFEGFYELNQGEGVCVKIFGKTGCFGHRRRINFEDLGHLFDDEFSDLCSS
jgi:hypothetical protein